MNVLEKHWQIQPSITPEADQNLAKYPPFLRQVLFNRGFGTADESNRFLAALPTDSSHHEKIKGLRAAVDRLMYAIAHGESIVVYGDYDCDGVTATALLCQCLLALGGHAQAYIPDRFEEGYGLNVAALRQLRDEGAKVVVSVDCGIRSLKEAAEAKQLGLDLIITDHHTPGPELPDAFAIINTKQAGDEYPEKQLAGVGTAFRLAHALEKKVHHSEEQSSRFLDLVALGTVADMVPLVGENRWMVREGLAQIRSPKRQGLFSLISISGLKAANVRSGDIGYMLGPRLNAAGRLETAKRALLLLMTDSVFEAGKLAQDLDNQNRARQELTVSMTQSADEIITTAGGDPLLLFAFHPEYNSGVVGLVASRLTEKFYRPSIVGQRGEETTRASCRSIPEFHITQALESCAELFENFGGHAAAAGFTVRNDRLPEVMDRLNAYAQEKIGGLSLRHTLIADLEIPLVSLKPDLLNQIELIEPTGYGNPQISLVSRGLQVRDSRAVGSDSRHLKLTVTDGWITYDAIAFGKGEWAAVMPKAVDLLYRFETNEFNGRRTLQLNVRDLKPSA